jgi:hypothetical protein
MISMEARGRRSNRAPYSGGKMILPPGRERRGAQPTHLPLLCVVSTQEDQRPRRRGDPGRRGEPELGGATSEGRTFG